MFVSGAIKISILNKVRRAVVRIKLFYHNKESRFDARSQWIKIKKIIAYSFYLHVGAVESTVICFYQNYLVTFFRNCQVLMELLL